MRYKPFDFDRYRNQRAGHNFIEIDLDALFAAHNRAVMGANPTLLREALQDLLRELIDLAKRPESDPELQFDRVCELECRFNDLITEREEGTC
jgi:hypothetical protein